MFNRLIVATDLSAASFGVVNCLGGLRPYGAKKCLLLKCLTLQEASSIALSYNTDFLESTLREQKEVLEKHGFSVETRVVTGGAQRTINRIAVEENYSLVVVGSSGQSLIREALLGSVASDVISHARKPVLVVRLEVKPGGVQECVHASRCNFSGHVLFPTDFSENADHAFAYVEKLVADGTRSVTLLHVQDKALIDANLAHKLELFNEIDRVRLEKMKEDLRMKGGAEIAIELRYGSPFVEISSFIRERDVNLVVLGSQGRGFVEELFLGSVSHNVVRHSEAAVLLIPIKHRGE